MKNKKFIMKIKPKKYKKYCLLLIIYFLIEITYFIEKQKKKKGISVCLCVIGKNENIYAKEYVNHYKKLGYNHIFVYDNNDKNKSSERFLNALKEEVQEGFVSIIDFFGYRGKSNNSQYESYYDCYEKNNRKYDWLSFFDFDEFLELKPQNQTIQQFLSNERYKKCHNIKINWLHYESEKENLYYENKSLFDRFKKPMYDNSRNRLIKSTIRGKLTNYWRGWQNPHSSLNRYKACSSSGNFVDTVLPYIEPPDHKYAVLRHYFRKSFEEFCKKLKRGWPEHSDQFRAIVDLINENKNDEQKLNIIKKFFNITNYGFL